MGNGGEVRVKVSDSASLSARLTDTDDYDTRQYGYEQDVLLAVSVPALYGQGTRVYGLAEIRVNRAITRWLRYATDTKAWWARAWRLLMGSCGAR